MVFGKPKDLYFLAVMALIKVVSRFSSRKPREFITRCVASAAYLLSREKRRLAEKNISEVFGDRLSDKKKQEIIKGNFYEFWKDVLSLSLSDREKGELKRANLHGLDHLEKALRQGNGVILWESGSFGSRNLAKQILWANGYPVYQVHREGHIGGFWHRRNSDNWLQNQVLKPFFKKREKEYVADIIYLPNSNSLAFTRRLLERLRQNAIICSRSDFSAGQKFIPQLLLGHKKFFPTGMISLAKISGARILPIFCFDDGDDKANLFIEHPINIETDGDRERSTQNSIHQYTLLLESYIRRYPEKYHGWHIIDQSYEQRLYGGLSQGKTGLRRA